MRVILSIWGTLSIGSFDQCQYYVRNIVGKDGDVRLCQRTNGWYVVMRFECWKFFEGTRDIKFTKVHNLANLTKDIKLYIVIHRSKTTMVHNVDKLSTTTTAPNDDNMSTITTLTNGQSLIDIVIHSLSTMIM